MFETISTQFVNLETVVFQVATALFYPVLVVEVVLLSIAVFDSGLFTAELIGRGRRRRSLRSIEQVATEARDSLKVGKPAEAAARLATLRHGRFVASFGRTLVADPDFDPVKLTKQVADLEFDVSRRLERTRIMIRVGPILGLMTTLIPISPALVALAKGDVQTLSQQLILAFSTTVIGLLIGALGYMMTAVRDRLYTQDVSDVEYALEMLEV